MIEMDDEMGYISVFWGGYSYDIELSRIAEPEDVLWWLLHITRKEWEHTNPVRIQAFIEAIAARKGWAANERIQRTTKPARHPNEAPPAFINAESERAKMTPSLRYEVIKRDGYRCRCCGYGVAEGARLHVDHIHPVSKGGLTVEANLQTLCWACNTGKGAS